MRKDSLQECRYVRYQSLDHGRRPMNHLAKPTVPMSPAARQAPEWLRSHTPSRAPHDFGRVSVLARAVPGTVQRARIASTVNGWWDLDQTFVPADDIDKYYSCKVKIDFLPRLGLVDSSDVRFIQIASITDFDGQSAEWRSAAKNRLSPEGFAVDRYPFTENTGNADDQGSKYGWSGTDERGGDRRNFQRGMSPYQTPGATEGPETKAAHFEDSPTSNRPSLMWLFETAAVSNAGSQLGQVYGVLIWGFSVDADWKLRALTPSVSAKPTAELLSAVAAWNKQAERPDSALKQDPYAKEAKGQVPLPDLHGSP